MQTPTKRPLAQLMLVVVSCGLLIQSQSRAQETATKAYEKAYNYILDEKWTDAQKSFADLIKKYQKSNLLDAASYWYCYTRDKLGENKEQVFECYRDFIKSYPKSKWVGDAKSNMVHLAYQLDREGKPEYGEIVK